MSSKIVSLSNFLDNIDFFVKEANLGKIFVYPTDTVYGIGGIFPDTLKKIYEIKQRPTNKKVSIIYPKFGSFFLDNLPIEIDNSIKNNLYKILLDLRKKGRGWTIIGYMKKDIKERLNEFAKHIYKDNSLGIRILNHPFQNFINVLKKPFITTSANISGYDVVKSIDRLSKEIYNKVDWIIDGGILDRPPSVLIDIRVSNGFKIINR